MDRNLIEAFLQCKTADQMDTFLIDLLTESERNELEQRRDIAKRLHNKESYQDIVNITWASSTTIARVARFLNQEGSGYKIVLNY